MKKKYVYVDGQPVEYDYRDETIHNYYYYKRVPNKNDELVAWIAKDGDEHKYVPPWYKRLR